MADVIAPKNATEVIPRLWQGGKPAPSCYSFNFVVLVDDEYQPPNTSFPCSTVVRVPLNDYRAATPAELEMARQAAVQLVAQYRAGKSILVTCGAGLNRSGLVTGLTLKMLGYSDDHLVRLIRAARGDRAIRNSGFLRYISKITPLPGGSPSTGSVVGVLGVAAAVLGFGALIGRRLFGR